MVVAENIRKEDVMFKKILVPLDGSKLAEGILPYVTQLARGLDIPVTLLSVVDPRDVEMPRSLSGSGGDDLVAHISSVGVDIVAIDFPPSGSSSRGARLGGAVPSERGQIHATQIYENASVEMQTYLNKQAKSLTESGLDVTSLVLFGNAPDKILDAAKTEMCGLIAMSTHGHTALGRGFLGSVADRVVHTSGLPTLVVSPERAEAYWSGGSEYTSLMVPLDGSALSEQALPVAEHLARELELDIVLTRAAKTEGIYPYVGTRGLEIAIEKEGVSYLQDIGEGLEDKGLNVSWELLRGTPTGALMEFAQKMPQDMIVMTTHGRSGIRRLLLGSVAEALVRSSGDPVLLIPAEDEK